MRGMLSIRMLVLGAVLLPGAVAAQRGRPPGGRPDRAALEQDFRQRLAQVVQKQVGLNDDEMRRLTDVNNKYEPQRQNLVRRERDARMGLRRELMGNETPNQDRISQLLQQMARVQHERLDLTDREQADLSQFLTPVQRARYLGLQEQMRRRIEQFRDRPLIVGDSLNDKAGAPGRGRRRPPPG